MIVGMASLILILRPENQKENKGSLKSRTAPNGIVDPPIKPERMTCAQGSTPRLADWPAAICSPEFLVKFYVTTREVSFHVKFRGIGSKQQVQRSPQVAFCSLPVIMGLPSPNTARIITPRKSSWYLLPRAVQNRLRIRGLKAARLSAVGNCASSLRASIDSSHLIVFVYSAVC